MPRDRKGGGPKDPEKLRRKILAKELHKQPRLKFKHKLTTSNHIDDVWSADIVDLSKELQERGYRYLLTVLDVLSRFAYVVPLKSKDKETTSEAFQLIFSQGGRKPNYIWTDRGGEFNQDLIGVPIKLAFGPIKVGIIERFNKTLKTRMWYKLTKHDTKKWMSRLPKIVHKYNHTVHSSTGMTPYKAYASGGYTPGHGPSESAGALPPVDSKIESLLLQRQHYRILKNKYKYDPNIHGLNLYKKKHRISFKLGDSVRIVNPPPKSGDMFKKGYRPRWSEEIFTIDRVIESPDGLFTYSVKRLVPITLKRKNQVDKVIMQNYYSNELQKTSL
jgi:hypothetical protein